MHVLAPAARHRATSDGILSTIGATPLVHLRRFIPQARFELLAKLESLNPGGSIKDRPAVAILEDALRTGFVRPHTLVIESSSGNMGIGLAQACRYHGLRFLCVVDPKTAPANLRLLRAYGAAIDMVTEPDAESGEWLQARLNRVQQLVAETDDAFWPNQYVNRKNSGAHYDTTMREIAAALDARLDFLFVATSTCGTVRGCSEYIRDRGMSTRVIAVDAVGSLIFSDVRAQRLIPGLGAGLRPPLCDRSLIDDCVHVDDLDCVAGCRRLAAREAILGGGSSGGVLAAVEKIKDRVPDGAVCVAILPDRGERYLETVFCDEWVRKHFGDVEHLWREVPAGRPTARPAARGRSRCSQPERPRCMRQNGYQLSSSDVKELQSLLGDIAGRFGSVEDREFLGEASLLAQDLPVGIRACVHRFRLHEPSPGHCEIAGYPIDARRIGPTPAHWRRNGHQRSRVLEEEIYLVLLGSLLGEVIGWATQQDGRIVHDVAPIAGHESEQLGSGSEQLLWWHTEDAFHPYRGDYLGMFCLRNPDQVATTVAEVTIDELEPRHRERLFEPRFVIRPDNSHKGKNSADRARVEGEAKVAYSRIEAMDERPDRVAVFTGSREAPYVRVDPFFMDPAAHDPESQAALAALVEIVERKLEETVLCPGDVCLIDNLRAVHGRRPFKARYDGNDRWLKRINIARDLRRSRDARPSIDSRIIG